MWAGDGVFAWTESGTVAFFLPNGKGRNNEEARQYVTIGQSHPSLGLDKAGGNHEHDDNVMTIRC